MNKNIEILLNTNPSVGNQLTIGDGTTTYFTFTFVTVRQNVNQVTIGSTIAQTIKSLADAFYTDYNLTKKYEYSYTSDTFTFGGAFSYTPQAMVETTDSTTTISDREETFAITDVSYSSADSNYCQWIEATITANDNITEIVTPTNIIVSPPDTTTNINLGRGGNYLLRVKNALGDIAEQSFTAPSLLNAGLIDLLIFQGLEGIQVVISHSTGLNLEYSLDNVTWKTNNMFHSLSNGAYTLYVRDQYGCNITKEFTISIGEYETVTEPHFKISKANSIRFAQRKDYDCANFKTDESSLSCETDKPIKYQEKQQFQSCDIITTQIETSYSNPTPSIIVDGVETYIPYQKITDFINKSEKRDAKTVTIEGSSSVLATGIYFISGNVYDFDDNITGEHYLNGELPEWAYIGGTIIINSVQYPITDISYNESLQVYQIELAITLTGDVIVGSVWNQQPYDYWEFDIDMADYIDQDIQVRIQGLHAPGGFPELEFLSEVINVKETQENTLCIEYWNNENSDIYIGNEIRHKLRLLFEAINGDIDNDAETYKTDETINLYDVQNFEVDVFKFTSVTKEMMRKLVIALSSQNVLLNGVAYVKKEISSEVLSDYVNLYDVVATMIKAESGVTIGYKGNTQVFDVPALVEGETGFISG